MVNYYYFAALLVAYVQYHSINKQKKKKRDISVKIKTDTKDHKKTLILFMFKRISGKVHNIKCTKPPMLESSFHHYLLPFSFVKCCKKNFIFTTTFFYAFTFHTLFISFSPPHVYLLIHILLQ